jgi:hypothetical protein
MGEPEEIFEKLTGIQPLLFTWRKVLLVLQYHDCPVDVLREGNPNVPQVEEAAGSYMLGYVSDAFPREKVGAPD